jgi:hypothetical protein
MRKLRESMDVRVAGAEMGRELCELCGPDRRGLPRRAAAGRCADRPDVSALGALDGAEA